ncbi:MAG: hypothetical protein HY921_08565 [Elusimicrobia bacterium]|nr:hypothetical protein [Elusimicrobiota bacterium]
MKMLLGVLFCAGLAAGAYGDLESFDLSGFASPPETFLEQQISEMVKEHRKGDLEDARGIQTRLARYYRDKGDAGRAAVAEKLASASEPTPVTNAASAPAQARGEEKSGVSGAPSQAEAPPVRGSEFHGRYYRMEGRLLHTWDFNEDGTFYHATVISGSRTGERGEFEVKKGEMILRVKSQASAFMAQGVGGRSTVLGGGQEASEEVRRLKFKPLGPGGSEGILLDGQKLKPKSW